MIDDEKRKTPGSAFEVVERSKHRQTGTSELSTGALHLSIKMDSAISSRGRH